MNMGLWWAREGKIWCCIVLYFEAGFEGIQNKVSFRRKGKAISCRETKDRKRHGNQQYKVWHKDLEGETTEGSTESTGGCINFESCRRHKIHSRFNMLPWHWLCVANSSIRQYEASLIVTEYTTTGAF